MIAAAGIRRVQFDRHNVIVHARYNGYGLAWTQSLDHGLSKLTVDAIEADSWGYQVDKQNMGVVVMDTKIMGI